MMLSEVIALKKDFGDSIGNTAYEYRVLARMSQQELADKVGSLNKPFLSWKKAIMSRRYY